jgi:ankyrin repeat protein
MMEPLLPPLLKHAVLGGNVLHRAVDKGDASAAKRLCQKYANMVHERDFEQRTPLLIAAERGFLDIVVFLVSEVGPCASHTLLNRPIPSYG